VSSGNSDEADVIVRRHRLRHAQRRDRRSSRHVVPALLECVGDTHTSF